MLDIDAPNLQQISTLLSGEIQGGNPVFSGVVIDSRNIAKGNLFVAIRGPRFDGHNFLEEVKKSGAVAAIVDTFIEIDFPQLKVKSTLEALTQLAGFWRDQVQIPVIGITGSNGKTTVKEMAASILSQQSFGLKTAGNFNNEIGVPLTLLRLTSKHRWAVIEMGASHVGEIDALAKLVKPTVGLVNNISSAHVEGFGSLLDTAKTKGALFANLQGGVAVMPEESEYRSLWQEQSTAEQEVTFGQSDNADIWYESQDLKTQIHTPNGAVTVQLPLVGEHNYSNAAAATAIALACNTALDDIQSGLENLQTVAGRLEEKQHQNGLRVIDDTYNANPYSAKAALDYLAKQSSHTIFVLGDMGELGENEKAGHQEVGVYANTVGISAFYTVGKASQSASDIFQGKSGHFETQEKLLEVLVNVVQEESVVLVKGSRFMQMEHVVDMLVDGTTGEHSA